MATEQNFEQMIGEATAQQIATFEALREQSGLSPAEFAQKAIAALDNSIARMERKYNGLPSTWIARDGATTEDAIAAEAKRQAVYRARRHYVALADRQAVTV